MEIVNEERQNSILRVLGRLVELGIRVEFYEESCKEIIVDAKPTILNKIEEQVRENFPECFIETVSACYGASNPCGDWTPEGDEWCIGECTNKVLLIRTPDEKSVDDVIEDCFKGDL